MASEERPCLVKMGRLVVGEIVVRVSVDILEAGGQCQLKPSSGFRLPRRAVEQAQNNKRGD